jgi:exopolysaccharide biosynthesis polyprenyl glycosylphosphotransferase
MSTSTLIRQNFSVADTAVARSIPGLRNRHFRTGKKAPRSLPFNATQEHPSVAEVSPDRASLGWTAARLVVPLADDTEDGWRVLLTLVVVNTIVFFGLLIAHVPAVIRAGQVSVVDEGIVVFREVIAHHLGHMLLLATLLTLMSHAEGLFGARVNVSAARSVLIAAKIGCWATLLVGIGLRLSGADIDPARLVGVCAFVVVSLCTAAVIWQRGSLPGRSAKNVLIVGTSETARALGAYLGNGGNRIVKGFISQVSTRDTSVLGTVDDLARVARAEFIDEVIVVTGQDRRSSEQAIAQALHNHLDLTVVPELCAEWPRRFSVQTVGSTPLIALHREPVPHLRLLAKRLFDVFTSTTALVLTAPVMLLVGVLIKIESPGPVFYCAPRAGRKGQPFVCYKFRTMYVDADRKKEALRIRNERRGATFKITNDPRVTPLGRVLRRYSLDEIPQLWNVLEGSMSMVGPRPHPLDDYQRYGLEDLRRLDVPPGITGLWQIKARQDPSFATNIALDLEYIEKWSLGLDLSILLKTFPAVFEGTGA